MNFNEILQKLCSITSISGNEHNLIKLIKNLTPPTFSTKVDNLYNLIAINKNKSKTENNVLILSAVDEPGLIINKIEQDGSLKFKTIGKINPIALIGSVVQLENTKGIIGQKPIHLQNKDEKNSTPKITDLFIDIGLNNITETDKVVQIGELATFENKFINFGDNFLNSKSINSKIGSAILVKLINSNSDLDFNCAFLTKNQISTASATVTTSEINPNITIILNSIDEINCKEITSNQEETKPHFIINCNPQTKKTLFLLALNIAKKENFKFITKIDSKIEKIEQAITKTNKGVNNLTISIPCRQENSSCSNVSLTHLEETFKFVKELISNLNKIKVE